MAFDLTPIHRRLDRAEAHIDVLEKAYGHFAPKLKRNRVVVEVESDRKQVARIYFDWNLPAGWGIVAGECLHHLRATLDNLVWQLVLDNDETPSTSTEFPIFIDSDKYPQARRRKLAGVADRPLAVIDALQPCNRWDEDSARRRDPLWLINEFDVVDKHHLLHVAAATPANFTYDVARSHVAAGTTARVTFSSLYNGAEIARFTARDPIPEKVKMDSPITLGVHVAETERTPFMEFPGELRVLHVAASEAVARVAAST